MKPWKSCLIFWVLLGSVGSHCLVAGPDYVWNINESGFFEPTNTAYAIEAGCVSVDLDKQIVLCPTGLEHLASGRESVKEIRFLFEHPADGACWLHIGWNGGGSGKEQFAVFCNAAEVGQTKLADAGKKPYRSLTEKFAVKLEHGHNNVTLRHLSGDGLRFKYIFLSRAPKEPARPLLNPALKFPTLKAYERQCQEPGIMLDDARLRLLAPKRKTREAKLVFGYLLRAYDELYRLVGVHPEYKLVVYHFPENNEHAKGGTSNCTIWYSYRNLELELQKEWTQCSVPHLWGYIEEMAHNFDGAAGAQFGWEMIGWNLGIKATQTVAGYYIQARQIKQTRAVQRETFQRYIKAGCVFPEDLPGNLSDRIHAHILWMCQRRYGPDFWQDFFQELRKEQDKLRAAAYLRAPDKIRNRKYQITVECFDRLPKIEFKKLLKKYRLSLTTAIKSLRPTEPGWDRKFLGPDDYEKPLEIMRRQSNPDQPVLLNLERFGPLHKATFDQANKIFLAPKR